ncbi:MAG: hypothetical protein ABF868_04215 [Sporolactobacillus sp.]
MLKIRRALAERELIDQTLMFQKSLNLNRLAHVFALRLYSRFSGRGERDHIVAMIGSEHDCSPIATGGLLLFFCKSSKKIAVFVFLMGDCAILLKD